jgi:transposase
MFVEPFASPAVAVQGRRHAGAAGRVPHRRQGCLHDRALCRLPERTQRLARASEFDAHRHVAGFHDGVNEHLPEPRVTFDKFHVVAHASKALDAVRRQQQKLDPQLKGMRWTLLKDADNPNLAQLTDLEALVSQYTTNRTARAWLYREQLRDILERKQINVV